MDTTGAEIDVLAEPLKQCRLELAELRQRYEASAERSAQADRATNQAARLSEAVDAWLTSQESVARGPKGWLKRRVLPNAATEEELADARELRASALFDGPWYLRVYPEVVATGLSPALHYLRQGAVEGKDPGPEFSTRHYVSRHPMVARRKANPLLNHLRTHQ